MRRFRPSQADRIRRVGVLMGYAEADPQAKALLAEFTQAVSEFGWIVFVAVADPVASGFVASLSRPGGNVTGFGSLDQGFDGEQVA